MFSIKGQIILWLISALIVVPLISVMGLDRPKGEGDLSPEERELATRNRLRQAFEFLGGIGGAMGILYLMQRGMRAEGSAALAYSIMVLFLWTFGFIIALILISVVAHFLPDGARTGFFVILYGFFLFGFVLPLHYDQKVKQEARDARAQAGDEYTAAKMRLRSSWTADLRAAEAHGGEGVVPPMLEVIDSGKGVQVTNIGSEPLCLDLRRSHARIGAGLSYQCALWSDRGSLHSCVKYAPGHSEWLHLSSQRPDLPDCSGQPLEFRVGSWQEAGPGWWSDAALEEFDRETARLATDKSLYEFLMGSSGLTRQILVEATYRLNAIPVGTPRVVEWRNQLADAYVARASRPKFTSEERAQQGAHLNQVREAEAALQAIANLRHRQSRRDRDKDFPDYLPVEDEIDRAVVRHPLGAVFYVSLTRVGKDPETGQEFLCKLRGSGSATTTAGTYVSASRPGYFELESRAGPCANPEGTKLEMVVNDFDGRLTFASPSALDRMHDQARARLEALQANPAGSGPPDVELSH